MEDASRGRNQILLLIVLVLTVGTAGYYFIEDGWSLMDAFFMTVITITTIGYGEVHTLSREGRIFTVLLIVFGLGTTAIFATHLARLLLENALRGTLGKRKMEKMIAKLSNHYVVCGYGQIGRAICAGLRESRIPFVVVESGEEAVELARQRLYHVLHGNATSDLALLSAGVKRARGLISALSSDADNLYISLMARELNPRLYIVVRGEGEGVEGRMHRAGADVVVSPLKLGGRQIAQMVVEQSEGGAADRGGPATFSSVLGFHLKVYKNLTERPLQVGDAMKETGAFGALARQTAAGEILFDPLPDETLAPDEALVLVLHEGRAAERKTGEEEETAEWDGSLSVGIMSIDEEHQIILGLFRKLKAASKAREREVIDSILNELVDYTVKHFRYEEGLLRKHDYPPLAEHMKEHEVFKARVASLLEEKDYLVKENLSALLNQWLIHHIMGTDKKYAEFLSSRGVR